MNPPAISPYLTGVKKVRVIQSSSKVLNGLPKMVMGSKPIDDGRYIFTDEQRTEFLRYVPIGCVEPPTIPSNLNMVVLDPSHGLFGLLTSHMHMV